MRRGGAPASLPASLLQVPHRLLTLTLLPDLELCLLCGPRPPLSQLDAQVNRGSVPLFSQFTLEPWPSPEHHAGQVSLYPEPALCLPRTPGPVSAPPPQDHTFL